MLMLLGLVHACMKDSARTWLVVKESGEQGHGGLLQAVQAHALVRLLVGPPGLRRQSRQPRQDLARLVFQIAVVVPWIPALVWKHAAVHHWQQQETCPKHILHIMLCVPEAGEASAALRGSLAHL
jgi:hypothetical protein